MNRRTGVVADANVLVSAAIGGVQPPAMVLFFARRGRFSLLLSHRLLAEVEDVLLREKFRRYLPEQAVRAYIRNLRGIGTVFVDPPNPKYEGATEDPKDDYLVDLAFKYEADYIVSGDRHLHNPRRELPVEVLSPADFIEELARE